MAHRFDVIGLDGAGAGWFGVWHDGGGLVWRRFDGAHQVLVEHAGMTVIAVDIPIGLSERDPRPSDRCAHAFVGGRRASSVFSAPVRAVLSAATRREASETHRRIDGRGVAAQAFGLFPKIRQ